jgi:hypothetical protein
MSTVNEANATVHPVTTQWHYPILIKYGFTPITTEQTGFVRAYTYKHDVLDDIIVCNTGASADYWSNGSKGYGYWAGLEPHLKTLTAELVELL